MAKQVCKGHFQKQEFQKKKEKGQKQMFRKRKTSPRKDKKKKIIFKSPYGQKLYESLNEIFKGKSFRKKWEAQQKIDQYKKEFIDKI